MQGVVEAAATATKGKTEIGAAEARYESRQKDYRARESHVIESEASELRGGSALTSEDTASAAKVKMIAEAAKARDESQQKDHGDGDKSGDDEMSKSTSQKDDEIKALIGERKNTDKKRQSTAEKPQQKDQTMYQKQQKYQQKWKDTENS